MRSSRKLPKSTKRDVPICNKDEAKVQLGPRLIQHKTQIKQQLQNVIAEPLINLVWDYFKPIDVQLWIHTLLIDQGFSNHRLGEDSHQAAFLFGYTKFTFRASWPTREDVRSLFQSTAQDDDDQPRASYFMSGEERDRRRLDKDSVNKAMKFAESKGVTAASFPLRWNNLFWRIDPSIQIPEYHDVYDEDGHNHETRVVTESKTAQDQVVDEDIVQYIANLVDNYSPDSYPFVRTHDVSFAPRLAHPNFYSVADVVSILKIVDLSSRDQWAQRVRCIDLDTDGQPILILSASIQLRHNSKNF